jgi:hypothetical protein
LIEKQVHQLAVVLVCERLMAVVGLVWVLKARSNNGAGPDLMMEYVHEEDSVHAHTLRTTLGEHKQHCCSLLVSSIFHQYGTVFKDELLVKQNIKKYFSSGRYRETCSVPF